MCTSKGLVMLFAIAFIGSTPAAGGQTGEKPPSGVSRADLFIASFGPAGDERSLRTGELEMREQVRLAFYGIDATRVEVEKGRLSPSEGESIIDGFKQTLRNYIHDHSNESLIIASSGLAADIPRIAKSLGALMSVARQDALMGREDIAQRAQDKMVAVLTTFSNRFAETCEQQYFPAEVALALERQNELLGTGIDLMHCAKRRLTAKLEYTHVRYEWTTCSVDGSGDWKLTISGFFAGSGKATSVVADDDDETIWRGSTTVIGPTIQHRYDGVKDRWTGGFHIRVDGGREAPPPAVRAPNDAGPNARPNNWPKEPVPNVPTVKGIKIGTLRMGAIHVIGDGYIPELDWIEGPIKVEEKPCKEEGKASESDDDGD